MSRHYSYENPVYKIVIVFQMGAIVNLIAIHSGTMVGGCSFSAILLFGSLLEVSQLN